MASTALTVAQELPPVGWLGILLTLLAIGAYVIKITKFLVRLAKNTADFLDDWKGEPARPGFEARKGIPERLSAVEAQLKTNGGTSLKDQTNRIERSLQDHIRATGGAL